MPNQKVIPQAGTIVPLDKTPLLGGQFREGLAILGSNATVTTGVILQGHPETADGATPATGSADWYTVLAGAAALGVQVEIADLPAYIRCGAAATGPVILEGIQ